MLSVSLVFGFPFSVSFSLRPCFRSLFFSVFSLCFPAVFVFSPFRAVFCPVLVSQFAFVFDAFSFLLLCPFRGVWLVVFVVWCLGFLGWNFSSIFFFVWRFLVLFVLCLMFRVVRPVPLGLFVFWDFHVVWCFAGSVARLVSLIVWCFAFDAPHPLFCVFGVLCLVLFIVL